MFKLSQFNSWKTCSEGNKKYNFLMIRNHASCLISFA